MKLLSGQVAATKHFKKDVSTHQMIVGIDEGVHRFLSFRRRDGGFNCSFQIVTYPWHLVVSGDMGSFVFSRVEDMFSFFRGREINPHYWMEKIESGRETAQKYCSYTMKELVRKAVYEDVTNRKHRKEILCSIHDEIFWDEKGEESTFRALYDFRMDLDGKEWRFTYDGDNIPDAKVFTYRYIWCCHAIVWAIQQYDKAKAKREAGL